MRNKIPRRLLGFTLIEILVVLVIISIVTAVSVFVFGSMGRVRHEKVIAQQLKRTITMAQQQAILQSEILELMINNQGYYFMKYRAGKWVPLTNDVFSHRNIFHSQFTIKINHLVIPKNKNAPPILFLPSGFVTSFMLQLKNAKNRYIILP